MNLISINMGLLLTSGQRPPPPPPPSPCGSPAEQNTDRQRKFVFYLQESLLSSSESGTLIVERPAEDQLEVSDSPGLSAKERGDGFASAPGKSPEILAWLCSSLPLISLY